MKKYIPNFVATFLATLFVLALAINVSAQDGKCRSLAKDPQAKCLDISWPEDKDFINKIVPLDTATVYFSSSAIDVIRTLGEKSVEDWTTYLIFPKIKKGSSSMTLDFEDRNGKRQHVYVTGNRQQQVLEFFVIEANGTAYHYALTDGGAKFEKIGVGKQAGIADKGKDALKGGAKATKEGAGKLWNKIKEKKP